MLKWWRRFSFIGKFAGIIGAVAVAITATAAAWPLVEHAFPAHRGLVYEKIGSVQVPVNELMLWRAEDQKNSYDREQSGLNLLLTKEPNPEVKALIQQQIDKSIKAEKAIDERIKTLKGQ